MYEKEIWNLYKPLRNRFRSLEYADSFEFIWTLWANFAHNRPIPSEIEMRPDFYRKSHLLEKRLASALEWELEFLLIEVIVNGSKVKTSDRSLKKLTEFSRLIKDVRDFSESLGKLYINGGETRIFHELNRIAHRQFIWQHPPDNYALYRYFKIHSDPRLIGHFETKFAAQPFEYYVAGLLATGTYIGACASQMNLQDQIPGLRPEFWRSFIARYSMPIAEMAICLKEGREMNEKFLYSFSVLRAKPIVFYEEKYFCPLATLLFWQITSGVYYQFLDNTDFLNNLGPAFEGYVGFILQKFNNPANITIHPEEKYGSPEKATTDWILEDARSFLFIECKAKRMTYPTKMELEITAKVDKDLSAIADAIFQVYERCLDFQRGEFATIRFDSSKPVYIMILTLENWFLDFNLHFQNLIREKVLSLLSTADMDITFPEKIPYLIESIERFERHGQVLFQMGICDYYASINNNTYPDIVKSYTITNIIEEDFDRDLLQPVSEARKAKAQSFQ
jgi:hypothetical protein